VIRFKLEYGAIKLLGLVKPPGTMACHRFVKCPRRGQRAPLLDRGFYLVHVRLLDPCAVS
jgi:hypothetical protein